MHKTDCNFTTEYKIRQYRYQNERYFLSFVHHTVCMYKEPIAKKRVRKKRRRMRDERREMRRKGKK